MIFGMYVCTYVCMQGFQTRKIVCMPNHARKSSCMHLARVIMFSIMKDMDYGHC